VIVYAGAIMVLILFVIMLLNLKEELRGHPTGKLQGLFGAVLGALLAMILIRAFLGVRGGFPVREAGYGTVESLGRELYGRFFYPFEVVSLLLVAAMVGAVLLAKRKL
jgi:NADH-quinone oxidoreductase subunit J